MRPLVDCLNKHSKLISKQDGDALVIAARALQDGGLNQFQAEQEAVRNALREANEAGESILDQIQSQRPQAHAQAVEFWNRETIRKAQAPPPLPRYVTEAREVPAPAAPAPIPVSETPAQAPRAPAEAAPEAPPAAAAPEPVAAEPTPVAPPEIPAAPISDAAQEMVDSLPPEQRAAAQKAVAQDDRDPLADQQRKNGQPVPKRKSKPVAPEKNKKLFDGVSRLGIFDKTPTEVLGNIASDPKNPRWIRAVADLLVQIGLGEGVDIRAVNTPNAAWGALYNVHGINGRPEVLINLSYAQGGAELSRRVLHELIHHGTLMKLGEAESQLTPGALAAKRELEKIFKYVTDNPNKFSGAAKEYGAFNNLAEFVSEVFANDTLRRQLNSIRPDGKISILQRIADEILNLLLSDRGMGMRRGSMLEAAVKGTIDVAGSSPPVTGAAGPTTAAMQAARLANAFPNFQEQVANTVAPMADNMGISDNDLIARKLDHRAAFYAEDERKAVESAVDERAGKINATPVEIADVKKRIEEEVMYYRAYHPANSGWANKAIKVLGLEDKKGLTRGDPTKQNPSGIAFKIKYKDTPYTYARDTEGKPIQRFLKQGKPDKETGKPIDNPEWGKRVGQLAQKMFDNLQEIMARRGKGDDSARVAQVIVDQINWYRDMRTRLRAEFGSMSDYVADVIAGFSPITDVPGNWNNFIEYFRHVMRGDYDEAFRKFDEYISADPENRSSGTYKKKFPPEDFPDLWPRKLLKEGQPLFGANTGNALLAGLDLWRAVKSGTAPKARNFGLNLIGQSLKATIDRWAGRYLQRMHAPTWRIPPSIEGAVTGGHMPGANVELVSGDFGMGQDVFETVATRLREGGHEIFKEVTAADLQAILWFAEKEVWEMRKWTDIMGAGSSMNVVAQATAAQRYEAGAAPGKTSAKDEKLMAETIELRTNLNAEAHMLGAKMVPSVNIADGKESKTFDGEWVTEPEYDPENSIGYVAKIAARLGKKAAHISRVIVNEYEPNPEITPGLHIFFKGRVGDTEVKGVLAALKASGISNGISLTVDPRVRPEVVKSLDPAAGVNQYNGVRVQFVPYDEAAGGMTRDQIEEAFADARVALAKDASIAESRVLYYDTLVLKKGTDYDSSGKLTEDFRNNRAKAWTGRARREGSEAATRRDNVQKAIADRKRQDLELESRMEREQQKRIADYAAFQRSQGKPDKSIDGGIDPPTVAAMQYQDETEPTRDPHGGRASLVRSMVNRVRNLGRSKEGIEIPESAQEVRGLAGPRSSEGAKGSGSAPIWRSLGETFRRREASLARRLGAAADVIKSGNPEDPDIPKEDPARYQNSQRLFDYLTGKETPSDPELQSEITELRREVPTVPASAFGKLAELDAGSEADVYHDEAAGVVYKLYSIKDGKFGGYVPGQLSLRRDNEVVPGMGGKPGLVDLIGRMERSNAHALTPNEFIAVTPEGHAVFAQPFIAGRGITPRNSRAALARAGIHELSQMGAISGVAKLEDGRWVLYDDLHKGNVRTLPGGRIEIIDANNRELDAYEIADLQTLGKLPAEKPPGPPKASPPTKKSQNYANATVVAPMVETHHGTPHEWAPEKKVRLADGTVEWMAMELPTPSGATVIERAPEGRVRKDKVGTGETNAAFGWGVLYSAARKALAEHYRDTLSRGKEGAWLLDGGDIGDASPKIISHDDWESLRKALTIVDTDRRTDTAIFEAIEELRNEADYRERRVAVRVAERGDDPKVHLDAARDYHAQADVLEKFKDRLTHQKGAGNVYTVQLDVDDPELLDWFMPMKDQMFVFDKVAAKFGVTREQARAAHEENEMLAEFSNHLGFEDAPQEEINAAEERWDKHFRQTDTKLGSMLHKIERPDSGYGNRPFDGEKFYIWMTDLMKGSTQAASEHMDSAGVPGIVFLDRESRGKTGWQVIQPNGKVYATYPEKSIAEDRVRSAKEVGLDLEMREVKGFNNYVIFDPERIKVVGKNGQVVKTAAEDVPAPPAPPVQEPVTVAAMAEVKDTDLSVAPMAGRGSRARRPWFRAAVPVPGYKPGGLFTPHAQLNKAAGSAVQEREQREKAVAYRAEADVRNLERALKAGYGKQGPDKAQLTDVQVALGTLDARLTEEQYNESLKYKDPYARQSFLETARHENVETARAKSQAALARLPATVRKYVNKLRNRLDVEAKDLLKGLDPSDTELRARVSSELGVFLHSDSYQHFESDVWGKHIRSDDPEAERIRRNAEILFKNEILGEQAHAYQVANPGTSDADALAHATAMPNIDTMVKNRLAAYLRKNKSEATRMHLLTGKMPIHRVPESQKLLSLNRENIPQEVRELWGQWTDPKINFLKTYTLLANHNADLRMQQSIVDDGLAHGYIWKPDPADKTSSPEEGLIPLGKAGDDGPLADAYGPQLLKDGMANFHNPEVQDTLIQINRWTLMMKTVGNIASGVHNFLGNIAFSVANGNLLWAMTMAPKTLISSTFDSFVTTFGRATGTGSQATQDKITEMIDLGVFDSDIAINTIREMARAAQAGITVEKRLGSIPGIQAAWKVLSKTGGAFKAGYQAADNWWKYFNFQIELAKQQWFYSGVANPPSLQEMKLAAANEVKNTLPSYSRVPEIVRRGMQETPLKYTGAFFTFQTESARTVINNGSSVITELVKGNGKQRAFAVYRTTGMMAMLYMPYLLGSLAKWMFGYDDEDEEALRNSLPEYQKNASLLVMLPKDEKGNPRYVDASFLNPYGLFHSAGIAGMRAYKQGENVPTAVGKAALHVAQPLLTVQPGLGNLMSAYLNRDYSRGGMQIYNPQDTAANITRDVGWFMAKGLLPGTFTNIVKAAGSAMGIKDTSGREPDPLQDITAGLAGMPRIQTLELDRAMKSHVGSYKKNMGDTVRLINEVVGTDATVSEGEVAAAYKQANAQAEKHFTAMHKAHKQLVDDLKMDPDAAEEMMNIGFGTEIMKGGLGKNKIEDIIAGDYQPLEISKKKAEETGEYHPERLEEYEKALEEALKEYDLQHPR